MLGPPAFREGMIQPMVLARAYQSLLHVRKDANFRETGRQLSPCEGRYLEIWKPFSLTDGELGSCKDAIGISADKKKIG